MRSLGVLHGAPNAVTYWRCIECNEQGLWYGRYNKVRCSGDHRAEVTVYEHPDNSS